MTSIFDRVPAGSLDISEARLQSSVVDLAKRLGYKVYHTHDSRRSDPGYPDLTIVGPQMLIYAELKKETGRVEPEQVEWLNALTGLGGVLNIIVCVWIPSDWLSGGIENILRSPGKFCTLTDVGCYWSLTKQSRYDGRMKAPKYTALDLAVRRANRSRRRRRLRAAGRNER